MSMDIANNKVFYIKLAKTPIGSPKSKNYNHFGDLCKAIADDFSKVLLYRCKNGNIGISGIATRIPQGSSIKYSFPDKTNVTENNILNLMLVQNHLKNIKIDDIKNKNIINDLYNLISEIIRSIEDGEECCITLEKHYRLFGEVIMAFKKLSQKKADDPQIGFYLNQIKDELLRITQNMTK